MSFKNDNESVHKDQANQEENFSLKILVRPALAYVFKTRQTNSKYKHRRNKPRFIFPPQPCLYLRHHLFLNV